MSNLSPVVAELERLYVELSNTYAESVRVYIGKSAREALLSDVPVISVASRGRKRTVNAWYRPSVWVDTTDDLLDALVGDRNDDGSRVQTKRAEIVVASEVLREDALTVAVEVTRGLLCHALHSAGYDVPESNYYARAWVRWAQVAELDANVNAEQPSKGWSDLKPTASFVSTVTPLLRPEAFDISRDSAEKGNAGSRMVKYRCHCTTVRAAVVLLAKCVKCGEPFKYADSAPVPVKVAARALNGIATQSNQADALASVYADALTRDEK